MKKAIDIYYDRENLLIDYNFNLGKIYYLGFVNYPSYQHSILFEDLSWLKSKFGKNLERINDGRKKTIEDLNKCLEHNVPMYELSVIENFDSHDEDGMYYRESKQDWYKDENGKLVFGKKLIKYNPITLSEESRILFKKDICRGLLVLCKLV
jgi:hypothetical protein